MGFRKYVSVSQLFSNLVTHDPQRNVKKSAPALGLLEGRYSPCTEYIPRKYIYYSLAKTGAMMTDIYLRLCLRKTSATTFSGAEISLYTFPAPQAN
jgi:hypothetical protein